MGTVVVLGGGVGGLVAAREIRARLSLKHRVVLVERQLRHVFSPSLLWLMAGARTPEQITRDIGWLSRRGIEVISGEVRAIDPERQAVETDRGTVQADALVVSLGLERTLEPVPGAAQHAHEFYSLEGADRLRQTLQRFSGGTVAIAVLATPYSCPAAPYEAALLLEAFLRRRGCSFQVAVYTPEPYPMPTAGPAVGQALRAMLEQRGIRFRPQVRVSEVRDGTLVLSDGSEASYDLLVAIPVHRAPEPVRNSPLAGPTGLVPVDGASLQTRFPGVWALGDVVSLPLPGRFQPDAPLALPKAGVFAHRQAAVVAEYVAAHLEGGRPSSRFDGVGFCFVEAGDGRAGFGVGWFLAEPTPRVRLLTPARRWHWAKRFFERAWLAWVEGKAWGEAMLHVMDAWAVRGLAR